MIQGLLKAYPAKRRPDEELKQLDAEDALEAAGYDLARLRAAPAAAAGAPALFGMAAPVFGMAIAAGAAGDGSEDEAEASDSAGSEASSEDGEPPMPPGPPCFHCGAGSWRTLGAALAFVMGAPGRPGTELMRQALSGNDFERGVLEEWLASRGITLGDALGDMLVQPNPAGAPVVRIELPGGAPVMPEAAWTATHACRGCAMSVLKALVYSLRERIQDGDLPARARGRASCWYGRGCRTQTHKPDHARKLNHICEQRRFH